MLISSSLTICYVAIGSNLGDSLGYLKKAVTALKGNTQISKLKVSKFYQSKPHGPQNQPDYYNAAVCFETTLSAEALLDFLQTIENVNERIREGVVRWGARTLDLDLLFYGDNVFDTKRLTVPHPRICERAFVLLPLRDLASDHLNDLKINPQTSIEDCIKKLTKVALNDIQEVEIMTYD